MEEHWRPIPGAERYSASSLGRVMGPRGLLKPTPMKNGYLGLKIGGKGTTAHAAVALAFHGAPPTKKHTINHKNGVKTDNVPANLEWVTRSENIRHSIDVLGNKYGSKPRLPPAPALPEPGTPTQTVLVLDSRGEVSHRIALYVPTHGRCDQHAAEVDGARCDKVLTATEIGRQVAQWIVKRPSFAQRCEARSMGY